MTTFYLSKSTIDRRVILDVKNHGDVITTIEADKITRIIKLWNNEEIEDLVKSAWRVAREKVDESDLIRFENRGWFSSIADAMAKNPSTNDSLPTGAQGDFANRQELCEAA